jgi:hypothetical protein
MYKNFPLIIEFFLGKTNIATIAQHKVWEKVTYKGHIKNYYSFSKVLKWFVV